MSEFTMAKAIAEPYEHAVACVREGLAEAGFGVLTEIDMAATLKAKLGVEIAPTLILGACRPQLAYQALQADSRVAALLPCNVVITAEGEGAVVEILDPGVMTEFTGTAELSTVADEARQLLDAMLDGLAGAAA